MFEQLLLSAPTARSIIVQTKIGNDVKNDIAPDIDDRQRAIYSLVREKHGARWTHRKPACGTYNCFGHLFASRRTAIREDPEIEQILLEDGYRQLNSNENICPGDIVIYRDRTDRMIVHGGVIMRLDTLAPGKIDLEQVATVPMVLSKWDDKSGEDLHQLMDIPFRGKGFDIYCEIWTDRT